MDFAIETDRITKKFGDIYNTSDILRSDDEVKEIRENRNRQLQIQQGLEQLKLGAEGGKTVAEAEQILKGGASAGKNA